MDGIARTTMQVQPRREEEIRPVANARSSIQERPQGSYEDVLATPENQKRVESALKALEIFQPNHPQTRFQYNVHQDTGRIQVTLVNYMTGEVVEEIPSKKILEFAAQLEELSGLVIEKKA